MTHPHNYKILAGYRNKCSPEPSRFSPELLTRGTIDILRHAAVGELDAQGVAVRIVDNVPDASAPVGNQRAVAVVQVLGAVGSLVLERARGIIVSSRLRHARQPVAVVSYYVVNSAKIHLHINNSKYLYQIMDHSEPSRFSYIFIFVFNL